MRVVLIGAAPVAVATARLLLAQHHEVVIIERDKSTITEVAETLDCGFLHGDGSRPAILREAAPADTDVLLCLSNHDQDNILASLVARSLGFRRVITKIEDTEFQHVCAELGLSETVVPDMNTARTLVDLVAGTGGIGLSAAIRGEARLFSFVVREQDAGPVTELALPKEARLILVYRGERPVFVAADTALSVGDEVVLLTHSRHLPELQERWAAA
jgi:trk system potassium uptake protein TrkA